MTDFETIQPLCRQIGAAHDMIQQILKNPENEIDGILWGALDGVQIILREAREHADMLLSNTEKPKDAFQEMCQQSKPDAPVMCLGEPIPDLEKELIAVLRETTKQLEDVASTGRGFLNDIDERDAVANEAPGGES